MVTPQPTPVRPKGFCHLVLFRFPTRLAYLLV
jgi:hypothetical protein